MLQSRNWNYRKIQPLLIWAIASLLGLFTFTIQGTPSVMIPELMQAFNIDITYIGILSSSFFYTYIVMQIPSGLLSIFMGLDVLLFMVRLFVLFLFFGLHIQLIFTKF